MKISNIVTSGITDAKSQREIDELINQETERRVKAVKGAEHFGVMTAAVIDGEFTLVSEWTLADELAEALENA